MGYTHYYYPKMEKDPVAWDKFCAVVNKIIELAEGCRSATAGGYHCGDTVHLVYECDTDKAPEVSKEMVRFNGAGGLGHETFLVAFTPDPTYDRPADWCPGSHFAFTKTARKPYDVAVVACCMAGKCLGVFGDWASDGERSDHVQGRALFLEAMEAAGLEIENEDYQIEEDEPEEEEVEE